MDFTYNSYCNLISLLRDNGYNIVSYHDWDKYEKSAILRHDIDYDIDRALEFAYLENRIGVKSTYFVLLTGDFYNIYSKTNREKLRKIIEMGHEIGLHFDETCYESIENIEIYIQKEKEALELLLGNQVKTISMHRPSKQMLDMNLSIEGIINSYGNVFFKEIKYLSDSRRRWREPVEEIVASGQYKRLQILTHSFWYGENEKNLHDTISDFVNKASRDRYDCLKENFTDLQSVMLQEEVR